MRRIILLLFVVSLCELAAHAQQIHPDIHYVPTSDSVIKAMFRLAQPMSEIGRASCRERV